MASVDEVTNTLESVTTVTDNESEQLSGTVITATDNKSEELNSTESGTSLTKTADKHGPRGRTLYHPQEESNSKLQVVVAEMKNQDDSDNNKDDGAPGQINHTEGTAVLDVALYGSELQKDATTPPGLLLLKNWRDRATEDGVAILQITKDESYQTESDESTHCHVNKKTTAEVQKARRQLIISSCLCLIFMLAEIIGGYLSNSLAIMTDAAHLLSDLAGFLISLFALWVGQKAPTRRMSFGYYRAEILGAVVSVLFIWVLTGVLVYMAVDRVRFPDYEIDADTMLIVSGGGVVINIIMGLVLHNPCGRHHHGHSHGLQSAQNQIEESSNSQTFQNINVRAAFIHVLGDLVQSIGVLIAAFIIRYKPEYKLADPICTFIFSLLVIFTTLSIMKDAVHVLMEGFPRNLNYGDVKNALTNVKGVKAAHSLHIWSLTVDKNTLSVHLAVDPDMDPHAVLQEAQLLIRRMYKIYHCTIQVEKYDPTCMTDCQTCLGPQV